MLDIFLNICSESVLTFIGQVWLVSVVTHKLMILPFFIDIAQNRHGLLIKEKSIQSPNRLTNAKKSTFTTVPACLNYL